MRSSNGPKHKALLPVHGSTLLEHNVRHLLLEGFLDVHIAINILEHDLRICIETRIKRMVTHAGGRLSLILEQRELGTIGGAKHATAAGPLLVVNVDNLTELCFRDLVHFHQERTADLTIASHVEQFAIPFGQLVLDDQDTVREYREKPALPVTVSSGTYVVSPEAREAIPPECRFDITDLFRKLSADRSRYRTVAYRHNQLWIDINDRTQLERADQMFATADEGPELAS